MKPKLTLYSRKDCCLCDDMKAIVRQVAAKVPVEIEEIDVDSSPELRGKFGDEVPVLFIDGRKAFKYRVTGRELRRRLEPTIASRLVAAFGSKK
jgi:glutaredoxin